MATAAALLIGVINLFIRPLILLLAVPLGFIVVFVVGFLVNAVVLMIASNLIPALEVDSWLSAIIGGLMLSAVNTVITSVLSVNDDDSFYQGVVERLARKQMYPVAAGQEPRRGLVMMEIDGLSYHHLKRAINHGLMPTLKALMDEEGYVLSPVDCGLPSQTSACQAGIMFGDNDDIPAFRWFDKDRNKLMVSGHDAAEINSRYAKGQGLMRHGSSINNMMNGDALKSLLTLADLKTGAPEEKRQRAQDIYLLMLNPYFFMRTIVLLFGDALLEIYQGWQQRRRDVQPRLNRLHKFYPLVRAATTVFMRDVSASLTILDIIRGAPALYVTWPGYDEVAHHSGPWTHDAFNVLSRYDKVIARVLETIQRKAPIPYEFILLSDHGQSFGATFKQRYGLDLKEYIETLLPQEASVAMSSGGDTGMLSMQAVAGELDNIQQQGMGGRVGNTVVKQSAKALQQGMEVQESDAPLTPTNVTMCGSGNLAQVYFDLYPRKVTLSELDAAYPGMVDALVQHEGVGFVVGYEDDGAPVVLGKQGRRNLHTGEVIGDDPLLPFAVGSPSPGGRRAKEVGLVGVADIDKRVWQVRRIADFPHAGDLIVNSTVYADGTVAAMEELIGNHGGVGGEQTDAFLFHPADLVVPDTRNSTDVFHILNQRRELPPPTRRPLDRPAAVDAWTRSTLITGVGRWSVWLGRAARSLILDRSAYKEVAKDPYMTGPALIIAVAMLALGWWFRDSANIVEAAARPIGWLFTVLALYLAGKFIGGKATFTQIFRVMSFALVMNVILLLGLIPQAAPFARFLSIVTGLVAVWIGVAEAHETRGWRTLVIPIVAVVAMVLTLLAILTLVGGIAFTLESLGQDLGLLPM